MAEPKPTPRLDNTADGNRDPKTYADLLAMRAARPLARAVRAPIPSEREEQVRRERRNERERLRRRASSTWVPELPRDLGRKGGRG